MSEQAAWAEYANALVARNTAHRELKGNPESPYLQDAYRATCRRFQAARLAAFGATP